MNKLSNDTERLCSFYISEWHLVTMVLPYINKQLNEKANIITFLENNIEENIHTLISKLNLKNEKEILEIDWKKTNGMKYHNIEEKINLEKMEDFIIFISGSKNYIDMVHENLTRKFKKELQTYNKKKVKVIDCYEITEFNGNIRDILDSHDKILNTAGEKEIDEVFEGYKRMDSVS